MHSLNPDQKIAAECLDRPVLVTAGAGSGKTRMLAHRYANAVVPNAVDQWEPAGVDEIVAITFTEKAAGEITERVRSVMLRAGLPDAARAIDDGWISTIHGLCSRLLRRHAFDAGVDPMFSVADTVQIGRLRAAAYEEAVRAVLEDDAGGVSLFERYQYDALFSACLAVTRRAAGLGIAPQAVSLEVSESAEQLLVEVQGLLKRGATTCDMEYAGKSQNPVEHAGRCEELLLQVEKTAKLGSEAERLEELLSILAAYKPLKSLKGLEEVSAELVAMKEHLSGRLAAAVVAPYARAFKHLVCEFSAAYERLKLTRGVLDFDDLQVKTVELLERRIDLAERYRRQFRVVMIDEFQDTDALQLRLVGALTDDDLCTVGDEKQSIYRFRGADIDVYRTHRDDMRKRGAVVAELSVNYRSCAELIRFVNEVFGSPEFFGSGPGGLLRLRPADTCDSSPAGPVLGSGPRAEVLFVDEHDTDRKTARRAEALCIARRLRELCDSGARPGDIAVLVRSYTHAHTYAQALSSQGLRAVVVGGSRFFGLPEITVMRALNRVIANPEDDTALGLLLASDFVPISSDALLRLRVGPRTAESRTLWSMLRAGQGELEGDDDEAVRRLVSVLACAHERAGSMPLAEVLLLAVEEAGWDLRLLSQGDSGRAAFANVLKFARQASEFESTVGTGHAGFAQHIDAKERLGDTEAPASPSDDHSDVVRIMSIHASKGLEFPVVVVPDLSARGAADTLSVRASIQDEGLAVALKTPSQEDGTALPASTWFARFAEEGKQAESEERARVLYVAFTRAQEMLLVSGSMDMRPKRPPTASHDLARIARVLGVEIPVADDETHPDGRDVAVGDARCRVRVVRAEEVPLPEQANDMRPQGSRLPPPAGDIATDAPRPAAPERLSYTQLSEFEHCPRRFWVRRVLGVRRSASTDAEAAGPLRFGTALHAVLSMVDADGSLPPAERMEAIARHFELGESECDRLQAAARRYSASELALRVNGAALVRREAPFSMRIGGRFLLAGAIDLYARDGDVAHVVDYKSGRAGTESELERRYQLQANCYALAVLQDKCTTVTVEFVRPEVELAGGGMQSVAFSFSASDAQRIEQELVRRYDAIADSNFEPSASHECVHCDVPTGLCEWRTKSVLAAR
jgi:ATP-dependent exoDNAse (exonuclease V) beta subunit